MQNSLFKKISSTLLFSVIISLAVFFQPGISTGAIPCSGDFDLDRDVDGNDLIQLIAFSEATVSPEDINAFAQTFGQSELPVSIQISALPPYPNLTGQYTQGSVKGVDPSAYYAALYVRVADLWYTKPYYASRKTAINSDCSWTGQTYIAGNDQYVTDVAAFLIPNDLPDPPLCDGCPVLPTIPEAVASANEFCGPNRILSFAGYDWRVKRKDLLSGPGPNYFSDNEEDVWVDSNGLHLTINNRYGNWYCTEVILQASLGYGTYIISTSGRVDEIDPNMVFGIFTWDDHAPEINYREMDIELSRWGNPEDPTNAQYVVQPYTLPGHLNRFFIDLSDKTDDLTHYMNWQPGVVEFKTYYGNHTTAPPENQLVHQWTFTGEYVRVPGDENIRINFWLFNGIAPESGSGDEIVVTNFLFQGD